MTKDFTNKLLNDFDRAFLDLFTADETAEIMPFPIQDGDDDSALKYYDTDPDEKLQRIAEVTNRISAERFGDKPQFDILLADLIDEILRILNDSECDGGSGDSIFSLLNKERSVKLEDALMEFDFFQNNPYKDKAERYLAKIEARKNRR
jgi:hypothetical protein